MNEFGEDASARPLVQRPRREGAPLLGRWANSGEKETARQKQLGSFSLNELLTITRSVHFLDLSRSRTVSRTSMLNGSLVYGVQSMTVSTRRGVCVCVFRGTV